MNGKAKGTLLFIVGALAGATASHFVTKKMLWQDLELYVQDQVEDVKQYYKMLRKEEEFSSPEKVQAANYQDMIEEYTNSREEPYEEDIASDETEDEEVYSEEDIQEPTEQVIRHSNIPYVITIDEYMQDREEFDKNVVTYFEGDDVLCDDREAVIPDVENIIGNDALTNFGVDSNDSNIVYIRNEKLTSDFEVVRDPRSYSEVVLGIKEEKEVRKMRETD